LTLQVKLFIVVTMTLGPRIATPPLLGNQPALKVVAFNYFLGRESGTASRSARFGSERRRAGQDWSVRFNFVLQI
jgi:hypothetical protein